MKISGTRRLLKEDFKSDDQELVGKLGFALNPLLEQLYLVFNKRITIADNLDMEFKDITLEVDGFGIPKNSISINSPITKINGILVLSNKNVSASPKITISSIVAGDSSIVTTSSPHGYTTGQVVTVGSSNSTPPVDGSFKIVVKNTTKFEVPVLTTVNGTTGNVVSSDGLVLSYPYVTFRQESKAIKILQITGLNPNTKYNLKLLILGQ